MLDMNIHYSKQCSIIDSSGYSLPHPENEMILPSARHITDICKELLKLKLM